MLHCVGSNCRPSLPKRAHHTCVRTSTKPPPADSFYHLPSTVIRHEKHKLLKAVYSFYNVASSMPLKELMRDALVLARDRDVDVFNALDVMENESFIHELKFGAGDGHLQVNF